WSRPLIRSPSPAASDPTTSLPPGALRSRRLALPRKRARRVREVTDGALVAISHAHSIGTADPLSPAPGEPIELFHEHLDRLLHPRNAAGPAASQAPASAHLDPRAAVAVRDAQPLAAGRGLATGCETGKAVRRRPSLPSRKRKVLSPRPSMRAASLWLPEARA